MKEMVNTMIRLGFIGAVAALLLAVVNYFAETAIHDLRQTEIQEALMLLAGGGSPGEKEKDPAPNVLNRWSIHPDKGWILEIIARGYGGEMTVMSAYHARGDVIAAQLLENNETVGFGKKAEKPGYMDIFVGKGALHPIPLTKGELGQRVDTVSGATITFMGISKALSLGSNYVKEWERQ